MYDCQILHLFGHLNKVGLLRTMEELLSSTLKEKNKKDMALMIRKSSHIRLGLEV